MLDSFQTKVEYAMLCDSAQVCGGKLYVLGGGWDSTVRLVPREQGGVVPPSQFTIAAAFLVDWNDTNRPLQVRIAVEELDEAPPLLEMRAQIVVGRPPQAPPGNPLRHLLALPIVVAFPRAAMFVLRAGIEGSPDTVIRFQVVDMAVGAP